MLEGVVLGLMVYCFYFRELMHILCYIRLEMEENVLEVKFVKTMNWN